MEFIIEDTTEKEREILENNNIDWVFDDLMCENDNVIVFSETEYSKSIKLLRRRR